MRKANEKEVLYILIFIYACYSRNFRHNKRKLGIFLCLNVFGLIRFRNIVLFYHAVCGH